MVRALSLQTVDGEPYTVALPEPVTGIRRAYLFAYHKSGSTLLNNLVTGYAEAHRVPTWSLYDQVFQSGIQTHRIAADARACFDDAGVIYTGFRHYPQFDLDLSNSNLVYLVRDPRDMLVSMYYSVRKSHVIPETNKGMHSARQRAELLSIDDYAKTNKTLFLNNFIKYRDALAGHEVTTYRYEDVIYAKQDWLTDLAEKLGLPEHAASTRRIAALFDVIPEAEQETEHIRRVHPGDHREKLAAATIDELNDTLAPFLEAYGYQ